jgi:Ca-activated chloride channel homolog
VRFDWPIALAALAVLPILVALYIDRDRRRVASQAEFGNPDLIPNVVARSPGRLRYLPALTLLVALVFLIVGVVSFATRAVVGVAPTADRSLVVSSLDTLKPGEGTAIGDAVALSLLVGRPKDPNAEAPPRAVVVISDGAQDGGRIQPDEAAAQAKKLGVPVYTVLVGTEAGVVEEEVTGGFRRIIRVPANPETLQQVAKATGGEYFAAPDAEALQRVYEELGSRLGTRKQDREITDLFAALAAGLLLVGGVTSAFVLKGVW